MPKIRAQNWLYNAHTHGNNLYIYQSAIDFHCRNIGIKEYVAQIQDAIVSFGRHIFRQNSLKYFHIVNVFCQVFLHSSPFVDAKLKISHIFQTNFIVSFARQNLQLKFVSIANERDKFANLRAFHFHVHYM